MLVTNFMSNIIKTLALAERTLTKAELRAASGNSHVIRLHGDGHVLENVQIEAAYDGERDKKGVLTAPGGVEFRTEKGKKLFLKYIEFSFLFNHSPARA